MKGRYYWSKRTSADIKTAISYFNQAIDKDPGYAPAYAGLADAYFVPVSYSGAPCDIVPKANAAAEKALELDPTLAHPHAVLASSKMDNWDFSAARPSSERPWNSIPATPPPISGLPRTLPPLVAGRRRRSMKPTGPISLIRCLL